MYVSGLSRAPSFFKSICLCRQGHWKSLLHSIPQANFLTSYSFSPAATTYLYLAPYTNSTFQTRSRNSTSVPDPIPVAFTIFFATRFSTYFTLPIFQPWTNVISSVASHFQIHRLYLNEIYFAIRRLNPE